jgi:hypothetical protein
VVDRAHLPVNATAPSAKPAARPDPSGPSAHQSLGIRHHRGKRVTSGGARRIGSKRFDPGAPTSPRPAVAGGPGACRRGRAPPSPSIRRRAQPKRESYSARIVPASISDFNDHPVSRAQYRSRWWILINHHTFWCTTDVGGISLDFKESLRC